MSHNGVVIRRTVGGLSGKYRRMAELYRHFARDMSTKLDFSEEAEVSLFNHESYGTPLTPNNGFAVGKQYLNLQVTMWREDLRRGWIFKHELYEDENYPHWWLDSVLKGTYAGATYHEIMYECTRI
jgi:hypothetical protein